MAIFVYIGGLVILATITAILYLTNSRVYATLRDDPSIALYGLGFWPLALPILLMLGGICFITYQADKNDDRRKQKESLKRQEYEELERLRRASLEEVETFLKEEV